MRILIIVLVCATVVFSQSAEAPTKEKIAVYVTGNVRPDEKKALGTKILVDLINSGRYRAVERSDDFVKELDREQSKQMSGAVDDNQITTIGKQFGVQIICVADLTPAFGSYQISARLIEVESAEIIAIAEVTNTLESIDDLSAASKEVVRVILGGNAKKSKYKSSAAKPKNAGNAVAAKPAEPYAAAGVRSYNREADFTGSQRIKTGLYNWLIPSLGSFTVMKDYIGGFTQLGLATGGYVLLFNGIDIVTDTIPFNNGLMYGYQYERRVEFKPTFWIGYGLLFGNTVFNIYRSATYRKPSSYAAENGTDGRLYFAILPDRRDGVSAVVLYNMSF